MYFSDLIQELMKVLVTGGNSQFAQSMRTSNRFPELEIHYVSKSSLDITDFDQWMQVLSSEQPDVVINAAAYTNVEEAEAHSLEAFAVNKDGAAFGALACGKLNIRFIHLSTDYVFDGTGHQPLKETDPTTPLNVYGRSKLAGEQAILEVNPHALVLRISWLYSPFGKNFYTTMSKLFAEKEAVSVVNDQIASPTQAIHLAENLLRMLPAFRDNMSFKGVVHYAEEGEASWYDFACEIHALAGSNCALNAVDSSFFETKAKRPPYSKLNNTIFKQLTGIAPKPWKTALAECYSLTAQ